MLFYSTNKQSPKVDFKQATINGQAPDKGLYFPEQIPLLSNDLIKNIKLLSKEEISLEVIKPYVGNTIPANELKIIIEETISFDFPLVPVEKDIFSLELFHGPTLAFKDVGARFMSRCLSYFVKDNNAAITVLVATSGDTGSAVANGFFNVEGINVVILYPSKKVSELQELQLTTYGNNIAAIEVDGSFDDCQQLVKQAFADEHLRKEIFLTSANSINVARWLPQQFYYFFAYQQWQFKNQLPFLSIPSGNFGNICAGLLANASGLPVEHFIASCNANDVIPNFLNDGTYKPKPSVQTISNAMDVGNPSNFVRIMELFKNDLQEVKNKLTAYSISDNETKHAIKEVFLNHQYLLDPHGAVAYCGLKNFFKNNPGKKGIIFETAHPIKFQNVVEPIINKKIEMPDTLIGLANKKRSSIKMKNDYKELKAYLKN